MSQTPGQNNESPEMRPDEQRDDAVLVWLSQDKRRTLEWDSLDADQREAEAAAALFAAASTPMEALPADLEARLLAAAEQYATPAPATRAAKRPWWASLGLAWGTASFASFAAVALAVRLATLAPPPPPAKPAGPPAPSQLNAVSIPIQPGPDSTGQGVQGEILWDAKRGGGYIRLTGLPVNDPSKEQYQLWIFDGTRDERYPVDGGVFNISRNGESEIWIRVPIPVREAALFAVTVEKPGGTVVSDRGRIVAIAKVGT